MWIKVMSWSKAAKAGLGRVFKKKIEDEYEDDEAEDESSWNNDAH